MAAAVLGCFVWTMTVIGLSFAMVERNAPQWWLMLVFGMAAPLLALAVLHGVRALAYPRDAYPSKPPAAPGTDDPDDPDDTDDPDPLSVGPSRVSLGVAGRRPVEPLSGRELEVLEHLAAGRSNTEIAKALYVAPGTVKAHLNRIFRKLGAASRLQAVTHARQWGILEGSDRDLNRP